MLWLCFKMPSFLFGNTRDTSVMHEKHNLLYLYATAISEIQTCSNKHETGLVLAGYGVKCIGRHFQIVLLLWKEQAWCLLKKNAILHEIGRLIFPYIFKKCRLLQS